MIRASCAEPGYCPDTNMIGFSGDWVLALQALGFLALVALIAGLVVFVVRSRR